MAHVAVGPPASTRDRFAALLRSSQQVTLGGLPTIFDQSYLVAPSALHREAVLWLAHSPAERDQLIALARFWFSMVEQQDGDQPQLIALSPESAANPLLPPTLMATLDGAPVWFFATTQDLRVPLPKPDLLRSHVLTFSTGQMLAPGALSQSLAEMGYELTTLVTERGTFARRGGIIDLWPFTSGAPLRFDILDQQLERITTFNWKTQRNRETVASVRVPPRTLPRANRATLFDYLRQRSDSVTVLMPDAEELATLDPEAHMALRATEAFRRVVFLPFAESDTSFDFQAAPLFHRDFQQLAAFLEEHRGWHIALFTARAQELRGRLEEKAAERLVPVQPYEAALLRGFLSKQERVVVLSDWEVFGREQLEPERRRTERADIVFVAELRPGDYVVHVDHGIGRFAGMTEQEMNGQKREYFMVGYAEDDKLFVPVEMADKLSKYIGVANPKLHRLSGSGWYQMTRKIKEETRATAEELLRLYAQRETVHITALKPPTPYEKELAATFLYEPTPDQEKAIADIEHDLRRHRPMDRLICGDVGFGKTEVAIRAAFKAVMNKKQVAILSPTTILTQQHFDTFTERLARFDVRMDTLSRFRTPRQQQEALEKLRLGQTDIIIGTHRLLQSDVQFKELGLVIIDEEQRFGVEDKEKLKALRLHTHVLTLTATPIPRTLNFALAGIRDISVIETPPEGRKPIETHIEQYHDSTVQKALERELERNGQVYFVYNHVETIDLRAREVQALVPKARVGVAHGQLPEDQLARVMEEFDRHAIDILVCSTIIENGLDLPNVNTLVVDQATNFGLAQLYQLRGRIGRGQNQAFSYFLYHSKKLTPEARKRLQALLEARELGSGFQLALRDLEIRGTGSVLGTKQHGHVSAVGLTMYSRLLAETIRELREGVPSEMETDIIIDLPVTIRIPKEMEPNEQKRLSYYQKLALESTVESLEARVARLFRRKQLPESVQNLVDVLKLKILGRPVGVTFIGYRKGIASGDPSSARITVNFSGPLVPSQVKALIDANAEWQFGENQIKIPLTALGKQWMQSLQQTFALLVQSRNAAWQQQASVPATP